MKTTAIILAGGKSTRYGQDKTKLEWNGETVVHRLARECSAFCQEILIVSNAENKFSIPGTKEIQDIYCDYGPLGGIHAGLGFASHNTSLVMACDMPLINVELGKRLLDLSQGYDAVVPCHEDKVHTLLGVYKKNLLPLIEEIFRDNQRAVRRLLDLAHTLYVERNLWPEECQHDIVFSNINYPQDYQQLLLQKKEHYLEPKSPQGGFEV